LIKFFLKNGNASTAHAIDHANEQNYETVSWFVNIHNELLNFKVSELESLEKKGIVRESRYV